MSSTSTVVGCGICDRPCRSAEERLARAARSQDRGIASARIDLRPQHRAQMLGSSTMIAMGVGQQDGMDLPPIEPQAGQLRLEYAGVLV